MSGNKRGVPTVRIVCSGFDGQVGQAVMEAIIDPVWLAQVRGNQKEDVIVSYYIRPLVHDFMQSLNFMRSLIPPAPKDGESIA